MKLTGYLSCFVSVFVIVLIHGYAFAEKLNQDVSKVLAVVPVKNGHIDQNVYRQFDRLVPKLKKISKKQIVKLNCSYTGQPDQEQDVDNAYKLAAIIEKYLRERHKLDLDLWVTIDFAPKSANSSPVLTISVLSEKIKTLNTTGLIPQK